MGYFVEFSLLALLVVFFSVPFLQNMFGSGGTQTEEDER